MEDFKLRALGFGIQAVVHVVFIYERNLIPYVDGNLGHRKRLVTLENGEFLRGTRPGDEHDTQ
jgi:hypothetical protein